MCQCFEQVHLQSREFFQDVPVLFQGHHQVLHITMYNVTCPRVVVMPVHNENFTRDILYLIGVKITTSLFHELLFHLFIYLVR